MGRHVGKDVGEAGSDPLPTIRVGDVEETAEASSRWLVEGLWSERAVGVLGGPPKSAKTWLAVDLALSVASGTKALDRYEVRERGPVVYFGAEDSKPLLKERFEALASRRGQELKSLEVNLLDVQVLRLDLEKDQERLSRTVRALRPRMLVLDPLVRMHRLDENSASEISALLSYLRGLEREYAVGILLVHHTRKDVGSLIQPGQGLRGSSDIHAWGDSNLYLRRSRDGLLLSIEHRSAPSPDALVLQLIPEPKPHLEVKTGVQATGEEPRQSDGRDSFFEEVLGLLEVSSTPLRVEELRSRLRVRKQRVIEVLRELTRSEQIERSGDGFVCRRPLAPA